MRPVGILGGTGAHGFGLALRLAAAGEPVVLGSRARERARSAARKLLATVPGARVGAATNPEVVEECERIALCVPFDGLPALLSAERQRLRNHLVVDVVVPLRFAKGVAELASVPGAGSVGELLQATLPDARVVSAFKNLPASVLGDLAVTLEADVLVCGDDGGAVAEVSALVQKIPGLRAVDAGGIAGARTLEAITALLVNLNRRHRAHTSIRITGL